MSGEERVGRAKGVTQREIEQFKSTELVATSTIPELTKELMTLVVQREGGSLLLGQAMKENRKMLVTLAQLRLLPPIKPPVLQPALRLVVKSSPQAPSPKLSPAALAGRAKVNQDDFGQKIVDNLNKNVREGVPTS